MPTFTTAPIEQVATVSRKEKMPSQRLQVQQEYQTAVAQAFGAGQALIVELSPEDKPLTVRNRIKSACFKLGFLAPKIRRHGSRISAYYPPVGMTESIPTNNDQGQWGSIEDSRQTSDTLYNY